MPIVKRTPPQQWDYDSCKAAAMTCTTRTEFYAHFNSAYMYARRHGFLAEICAHMKTKKAPYGYWNNKDTLLEHLSQCDYVHEFYKKCKPGYYASKANGWFEEITAPLKDQRFIKNYWTPAKLSEVAANYQRRTEFAKYCGAGFAMCQRAGLLDEVCQHMTSEVVNSRRICYAFEFPDRHVYVGISADIERRKHDHLTRKGSKVHDYIMESGNEPELIILNECSSIEEASLCENEYLSQYKRNGWTLLNQVKASVEDYIYEDAVDTALACQDFDDFRKNYSEAYWAALRKQCMEEITRLLPAKQNPLISDTELLEKVKQCESYTEFCQKYNTEYLDLAAFGFTEELKRLFIERRSWQPYQFSEILSVAYQCSSYTEFRKNHPTEYAVAVRQKWLDELHKIWPELEPEEVSKEEIAVLAKQYSQKVDFLRHYPKEYNIALTHGWLDELFTRKAPVAKVKTVSKADILAVAEKCASYSEFINDHRREYQIAYKCQWLDNVKELLPSSVRAPYTLEEVLALAAGCRTYADFKKEYASAYAAANKNNWLDEVRKAFPEAKHKRFTAAEIIHLAQNYSSYTEFTKSQRSAYKAACKMGITEEIKKQIS